LKEDSLVQMGRMIDHWQFHLVHANGLDILFLFWSTTMVLEQYIALG